VLTYTFFPTHDSSVAEKLAEEIEKHQKDQAALLAKKREMKAQGKTWDEEKGE
jgi:hypothetical protein